MSEIKWLNNLLLLENLIGIYRNYVSEKTAKKCFIIFHIFVQTMLLSVILSGQLYLLFIDDIYYQISFIYCDFLISSFITSLSLVVSSICNSRTFTLYIDSLNVVSKRFEDDNKYITSLKQLYRFAIVFILVSFVFAALRSYTVVINYSPKDNDTYQSICIYCILSQTLTRMIVLFEKVILFVFIMIVVYLCKCLNSLISSVQERVGSCDISFDEQCVITKEQIHEWVELYEDLANCCDKVTLCLGRQFFFLLLMAVSYYILLAYQMCFLSVLNKEDRKIAIVIVIYVLLSILPIIAGQLAHNQGVKFYRILARLYNTMIIFDSSEAEAKLIKDFIRLIKKNPIEIKLLPKLPFGTYLLPVILMSTVNYIIVMLQFSNIV